jgi:demethylmenaquinone methyltransferase/2-methoxy-6-polyprenyl-1,4-benzoquinol methylase
LRSFTHEIVATGRAVFTGDPATRYGCGIAGGTSRIVTDLNRHAGAVSAETAAGKPARIRDMFAAIVPRYDTINSLMTLGLDRRWRRETVAMAAPRGGLCLDIATGTGELAFEMVRQGARGAIGADFCLEMVEAARAKAASTAGADAVRFLAADAMRLPFPDAAFDSVVNGFMLRNVADLPATFAELCRVLKPGGRLACLDLTPPRGPMRRFFGLYIAMVVPLLGIVVGGNYAAYRYLYQSLSIHPNADQVAAMMRTAGFSEAHYTLTGFGSVAIHLGRKALR